ncbi:AAA family ATPase [Demetria terragena]|uniref:AAA family ATPase n=1 Tax=Demetria terragena TaxID=63959 RepID=UPI00036A7FD6|nr:AAA family ATPase [Demetria terragena]
MKLHRLSFQAFGPFPDAHVIDFDALGDSGIHLIHGATGAGKTSILDAICFAIFGQVPRTRQGVSGSGPASSSAAQGISPEVVLEATLAGRRLRFTRVPEYARPKKRGAGMTIVRSSVVLAERHLHGWQTISTRVQEVQHIVDVSLGLQLDQFAQVIMLPQGGFAEFLHAEPDARAGILQRLFDIERFTDIEQWFVAKRREATAAVEVARAPVDRARTVVELALADLPVREDSDQDAPPELVQTESCPEEGLPALIAALAQDVADRATSAAAEADQAHSGARSAHAELARAEQRSRLRAHARAARRMLRLLEAPDAQAADRAARTQLDSADRAGRVAPTLAATRAAAAGLAEARTAYSAAVPPPLVQRTLPDEASPAAAWVALLTQHSAQVRSAAEQGAAGRSTLAQARDHLLRRAALEQSFTSIQDRLDALIEQQEAAEERLAVARSAAEPAGAADELVRLVDAADKRQSAAAEAADKEAFYAEAVHETDDSVATATQHAERLRRTRVHQVTGQLSAQLRDGEPCSVCGSTIHPAPAELSSDEVVTQDELDAAEHAQQLTREAFDAAMADLTRARTAHLHATAEYEFALAAVRSSATEFFGDHAHQGLSTAETTTTFLQEVRAQTVRRRTQAQQARAETDRLESELDTIRATIATTQEQLVEAKLDHASARTRAQEAAATALEHTVRAVSLATHHAEECPCSDNNPLPIPSWAGTTPDDVLGWVLDQPGESASLDDFAQSLAAAAAQHRELERSVTTWQTAELRFHEAQRRHEESDDALRALIAQEGFTDPADVDASTLTPAEQSTVRDQLDRTAAARTRAETILADPDAAAALSASASDLEAMRAEAADAEVRARQARDRASTLERVRGTLRTAARDLHGALAALTPLRARHEALDHLAAIINAERGSAGDRRMRLSAYVLAARLEDVVRLANDRLATMTAQRFTLEHDDGPGSRGSRGGLGLRVHDAWTGTSRPTRTLSGGETFLASLALALALGEAIQHDAGGRQLDTLFIDEGFGSLDEDSLELVLEVLDQLRGGGRMVGIVSHVPELRQRIPAQIEVRKSEAGSSVRLHLPGRSSAA